MCFRLATLITILAIVCRLQNVTGSRLGISSSSAEQALSELAEEDTTNFWLRVLQNDVSMVPTPPPAMPLTPSPTPGPTSSLQPTPSPGPTPTPPTGTILQVDLVGPGAAFTEQEIDFITTVTNAGMTTAINVILEVELPTQGSFVSSEPAGSVSGNILTVILNDIPPGDSVDVKVVWLTPSMEVTLDTEATAMADNAPDAFDSTTVQVGTVTTVTGGVASAGTGLRNRAGGTIPITEIPTDAVVTRAVLVWAILFTGSAPSDQITLNGSTVTADLTATLSDDLCWEDSATVGYAADVTNLVTGNANYVISNPVNGLIREDSDPVGVLPYTDGASLFVFYGGPGINNQVIADFTYSAESSGERGGGIVNTRTLTEINSTGGKSTLILAGPDGQNNGDEEVRISATGSGTLSFDNSWDGSAPQDGPDFPIGNLWDNDLHDVSSILPAGQDTLEIFLGLGKDCTGLSAVVLEVEQ